MPDFRRKLKAYRWWDFKLPPILAIAYFLLGRAEPPIPVGQALLACGLFIVASIGIAGFGHLFNDLFDMGADAEVGAHNMAGRGRTKRALLLVTLLGVAWIPWFFLPLTRFGWALLFAEFFLFVVYSVPPVRLKTRDVWGAIADALYAHTIPVLVVASTFAPLSGVVEPSWFGVLLTVWSLPMGLRHIVQHQLGDEIPDRQSGIRTVVVRYGWARSIDIVARYLLPLEIAAFMLLLGVFSARTPWVALGFAVFVGWELFKMRYVWFQPVSRPLDLDASGRVNVIGFVMLSRFCEGWLPMLMLITLVTRSPAYLLLAGLHLVLFRQGFTGFFAELAQWRAQRRAFQS